MSPESTSPSEEELIYGKYGFLIRYSEDRHADENAAIAATGCISVASEARNAFYAIMIRRHIKSPGPKKISRTVIYKSNVDEAREELRNAGLQILKEFEVPCGSSLAPYTFS